MYMIDDDDYPDAFERNFVYAAVYSDRRYNTQAHKFHEHEDWMMQSGHFHPQLNDNSIRIAEKLKVAPLHTRVQEMVDNHNEFLDLCRQQHDDNEMEDVTFHPQIHPKSAARTDWKTRSLFTWANKRAQKVNNKLEAQLAEQAQQCTFRPDTGSKSNAIAKGYVEHSKVHDRLIRDGKRRIKEKNEEQEIMKNMRPRDFKDMWADAPAGASAPAAAKEKDDPVGFSPKKRPLSAPAARALTSAKKKEEEITGKPITRNRASMSLLGGVEHKAILKESGSCPTIGRMSRAPRGVSRFSRAVRSAKSTLRSDNLKTTTKSGVNTIALGEDFKQVAGTLLP
jgi:hypothetical protein